MRYFFFLLNMLCWGVFAHAIRVPTGVDARGLSLANIRTVGIGFGNVYAQPAALAWHSQWAVGTTYAQSYFSDKNLSTKTVAIIAPVAKSTFGLHMQHYGFAAYSERCVALSVGKRLGKHLAAGVQFNYMQIVQGGGYGKAHAVSCDIALYAPLTHKFSLGVQLSNPVGSQMGNQYYKERLPMGMRVGVLFKADKDISLMAEVETRLDKQQKALRLGMAYRLHAAMQLRAGFSTQSNTLHAGLGLYYKAWQMDFATAYHQSLGFSPSVSLSFSFGAK